MLLRVQGSARVIRCLQDAREELSYECRATLFDAEVRMAEDIDFKYPMKRSCTAEIQTFCPGIEHGHARVRSPRLATPCQTLLGRSHIPVRVAVGQQWFLWLCCSCWESKSRVQTLVLFPARCAGHPVPAGPCR